MVSCFWSYRHPLCSGGNEGEAVSSLSALCLRQLNNVMLLHASCMDPNSDAFYACPADLREYCFPLKYLLVGVEEEGCAIEDVMSCLEGRITPLWVFPLYYLHRLQLLR